MNINFLTQVFFFDFKSRTQRFELLKKNANRKNKFKFILFLKAKCYNFLKQKFPDALIK